VAARRAHNPKVVGSNPTPATKLNIGAEQKCSAFSVSKDNDLQSLLLSILQLPLSDRQLLDSLIKSKPASTLTSPCDGILDWQNELNIRGLSPRTVRLYSQTVKKVLTQYPSPTSQEIRAYLADRLDGVSQTKVRNDQKGLISFFNFLEGQKLWIDNPVKGMKLIKVAKVIRQSPDKEDVDKLLAWHGTKRRLKERLLIALLADTGMRLTEACSIQKQNISINSREIKVIGKGKKERLLPISPSVIDLLEKYLAAQIGKSPYLFPSRNKNGYQDIQLIDKTFRRLCKRLRIRPITPHGLRHYFATYALKNGAKLEVISRILGHASVGITGDVYRTVKQDEIRDEHQKFSPLSSNA
jgi:site-specific recombinase XerD